MSTAKLTIAVLQDVFAICRFEQSEPIPDWSLQGFCSITRTADELSIVCPQTNVPSANQREGFEGGWRALKVEGPLDFALTGVLSAIAVPLAEAGISLFAISTYETDYVLVKQQALDSAIRALSQAGHQIRGTAIADTAS